MVDDKIRRASEWVNVTTAALPEPIVRLRTSGVVSLSSPPLSLLLEDAGLHAQTTSVTPILAAAFYHIAWPEVTWGD